MQDSLCGLDCSACEYSLSCKGCGATHGRPFGGECIAAACCIEKRISRCRECTDTPCALKRRLIDEFNSLGISDMEKVTSLNYLKGSIINLEFTLPNGLKVKFWDDNAVYLGNLAAKKHSTRHYGLAADMNYLMVCECGMDLEPKIIIYKKWRR